jgi:type VI secretion system protein ImpC
MQIPSMPFRILALAPFTPQQHACWSEAPIQIDKTNLDQVMQDLNLSFHVPISKDLCPAGSLTFTCKSLKDFHPDGLAQNNSFLKNLLDAKEFIKGAKAKGVSAQEIGARLRQWPDLPPIRVETEHQKPRKTSTGAVDDILKMVALPEEGPTPHAETHSFTAQIDSLLQRIVSHVFSYQEFRDLEAVWRGTRFILKQGGINGEIEIEIVPVSPETLDETLNTLVTRLIQDLPSLVIVDLPFDNSPRSLELLEKIAQFAETVLAPTVGWITQKFFYLDTWDDLKKLSFLPHYLDESAFAKWRRLAKTDSARWLAVTCNRFLTRYPYGPDNTPRLVRFEEPRHLWISPVWALGCLMSQSFAKTGWPTRFTEWQEVRLEDLALNRQDTTRPLATETYLAEERIQQFIRAGIMPLVAPQSKDMAFMPAETTVASGSLSYQAFVSRVTHFILWCKDHFKKDLEPVELQRGLERAFSLFWEKSGHPNPENLEISASKTDPQDRALVKIIIEPSRQILPSREKAELEFIW